MRKYPMKMPCPVPHYLVPEEDESADCPDCNEHDGGECPTHGDWPSLMEDPDKLAEEENRV